MYLEAQTSCVPDSCYPGESWLWVSDHGERVVVDVGAIPEFGKRVAHFSPRIVVLTHDDLDHVGGLDALCNELTASPLRIPPAEFWIPADWWLIIKAASKLHGGVSVSDEATAIVTQVILNGGHVHSRHAQGIRSGDEREPERDASIKDDPDDLETLVAEVSKVIDDLGSRGDALFDEVEQAVTAIVQGDRQQFQKVLEVTADRSTQPIVGTPHQIGKRVAQMAKKHRDILGGIIRTGARLRLFDPDEVVGSCWQTEGRPGIATVINAAEVGLIVRRPALPPAYELFMRSALSVQNRRALAVFLWPADCGWWWRNHPIQTHPGRTGVIVWSDSDGRVGGQPPTGTVIPWSFTSVMSAPHHASTDSAHDAIWAARPDDVRVMLSANRHRNRPDWYRVPKTLRFCTDCARLRRVSALVVSGSYGRVTLPFHCTC